MPTSVVLAVASASCFLALAHAALSSERASFRRMTAAMAVVAGLMAVVEPPAGVALLAPVLFRRRLANVSVPANVSDLLDRDPADSSRGGPRSPSVG